MLMTCCMVHRYAQKIYLFVPQTSSAGEAVHQRQDCLRRYREKKARRMYTKLVRYQLRKINADRRPRIKGRFITKEEQKKMDADALARTSSGSHLQDCNASEDGDEDSSL